jgi:serine/threonine-protein kinase
MCGGRGRKGSAVQGTTFGRYRLEELLGQGGMGQVFRAYDTVTDRAVALKVLPPELGRDAEFQQRFRREALLAAKLNEPHIVPIHNFGEIDGRLYVGMRIIDGTDLDRLLATDACMWPWGSSTAPTWTAYWTLKPSPPHGRCR